MRMHEPERRFFTMPTTRPSSMLPYVVVILPNMHSGHNVGSFFRTSDGAGVQKIFLVGFTPTPDHPHVKKVSLGAEESVAWEVRPDLLPLVDELQSQGFHILSIEQTPQSIEYTRYTSHPLPEKIAVIFGNERQGVQPEVTAVSDVVIHIPMRGIKESLNVSIAGGIILYELLRSRAI
jgi:23S rRNA (guanosine2251-2'-O)-methyltransferase